MDTPKFTSFERTDVAYKRVGERSLIASIHIPKAALESGGNLPLLVHWHGGAFILGDRNFEPWFSLWLARFAEKKGAIIINPDYRLLPEVTGIDMIEDVKDFFAWTQTSLADEIRKISSQVTVDMSRVVVAGESAGGHLAVESALVSPTMNFKAVISEYGCIDLKIPHFQNGSSHDMMGEPSMPVEVAESMIKKYVDGMDRTRFRTSTSPEVMWPLALAVTQRGYILDWAGPETEFYPMEGIEKVKSYPPIWMMHGNDDTVVPVESSANFCNKLKKIHPSVPALLSLQPGDHGFSGAAHLDDAWIKEGCDFVESHGF